MAFTKALGAGIIEEDGRFHDLLRDAVAVEFLRRYKAEEGAGI